MGRPSAPMGEEGTAEIQEAGLGASQLAWVAKGMKSGSSFEGHLTALHSQLICSLQSLTSAEDESTASTARWIMYPSIPIY